MSKIQLPHQNDNILKHFPGEPRDQQKEALQWIENNWTKYDVFVIQAPTATGKSRIGKTIMDWQKQMGRKTSLITPTRILQDMYLEEYPDIPNLKGMKNYETKEEYKEMRQRCRHSSSAIFNFHAFFANKDSMMRDTLIVDEAHKLVSFLSDLSSLSCWKTKYHYPDNMTCLGDVMLWIESYMRTLRGQVARSKDIGERYRLGYQIRRMQRILYDLESSQNDFFMEYRTDMYKGRTTEQLFVKPLTMESLFPKIWTNKTKIILMSATISEDDIKNIGLGRRRVGYFECGSPIPSENRPFVIMPVADMGYKNQTRSIPQVAKKILEIAEANPDTKGIIHMPYSLVPKFRSLLRGSRFMFHTKDNKQEVYEGFIQSEGNHILVASGMEEGIDLVGDRSRWQIITKVMYPSLADNYTKALLKRSQRGYNWATARTVQQQSGRIARTPDDYGTTYMLDSGFVGFYARTKDLWSGWFKEAIKWEM